MSESKAVSESTSSSSEARPFPPRRPGCCKADCDKLQCESYTSEQIFCRFADAVVDIVSEFIFSGTGATGPVNGSTPIAAAIRQDNIIASNGTLIGDGFVLCAAAAVQAPPSISSFATAWPGTTTGGALVVPTGTMVDEYIRASRILVTVHNLNGQGRAYVFEAELVGTAGAAGVALLRINREGDPNRDSRYNRDSPCLLPCHPHIEIGDSLAEDEGSTVYLIGNPMGGEASQSTRQIVAGLLSKRNYVEKSGWARVEEVSVDAVVYERALGMPILNAQGALIGVQTRGGVGKMSQIDVLVSTGDPEAPLVTVPNANSVLYQSKGSGWTAGPSSRAFTHMIFAFVDFVELCREDRERDERVEYIDDPAGGFLIHRKGYLGMAYEVVRADDLDTTRDYTSGVVPFQAQRVRLDAAGNFMHSPDNKQIAGVRINGLAGLNPQDSNAGVVNGSIYVPGSVTGVTPASPLLPYHHTSPLSLVSKPAVPGDIVVGLAAQNPNDPNQVFFGDELGNQIAPSLVLWSDKIRIPRHGGSGRGEHLNLVIRRGGNALNTANNSTGPNYRFMDEISVEVLRMPPHQDYPWVDLQHFNGFSPQFLISTGWAASVPATQLISPLLPAINGAPFRPAI
jgi:hypothetical protein